jgi:hypothetical protein
MGIILDSQDQLKYQILDTIIVFLLGSLLLFFFTTMVNFPRIFLVSFATYITILILLHTIYMNRYCTNNNNHKNKQNLINFMSVYTICLNLLMIFVVANNYI